MRPFSLKARISLAVSLLILVILTGTGALGLYYFETSFRQLIREQQSTLVTQIADHLDIQLKAARDLIVSTAAVFPLDLRGDADRIQEYLDTRLGLGTQRLFDNGIFLFNAKGKMLAESPFKPERRGQDYSYREYFQKTLLSGQPQISAPYLSSQSHRHPAINFTAPLRDSQNQIVAVLVGSVDLFHANFLGNLKNVRIGKTGYLSLFNRDGRLIMHPDEQQIMQGSVLPGNEQWRARAIAGFAGSTETLDARGLRILTTFKPLNNQQWILAANYPTLEAFQPIFAARNIVILGTGVILLLAILLTWGLTRLLLDPLVRLNKHVAGFSRQNSRSPDLDHISTDEVAVLASTFDQLMQEVACEREFSYSLLQNSASPCFVIDVQHRVLVWTRALEELTGVSSDKMVGTKLHWQAFYAQKRPCLADIVMDNALESAIDLYPVLGNSPLIPDGLQAEGWLHLKSGKERYLIYEAAPIRDRNGRQVAVIETLHDLTNLKRTENQLRETQSSYHALIDSSPDAILVHRQGQVLLCNLAAVKLFHAQDKPALMPRPMTDLIQGDVQQWEAQSVAEGEQQPQEQDYREEVITCCDGQCRNVEIGSSATFYNGAWAVQSVLRDITERKAEQERIWHQANFDTLTKLPNRNLFMDRLQQTVARCDRENQQAVLLFIDLDHFKEVNDRMGHDNGDELLRQVAQRMRSSLRQTDTLARLGGDEFTIILPISKELSEIMTVTERLLTVLNQAFDLPGGRAEISASIGGAVYPLDGKTIPDLMCVADASMYQVKQTGRNGSYFPSLQ